MKKILIFSTAYLPLIGGAELAVKEITDRLGDEFEADLICARIKRGLLKKEKIGRVQVWRVGWGWGRIDKFLLPWRGFKLAHHFHNRRKYDAVWGIMASFGGLAALVFKSQHWSVPFLLTLQEGDTPQHIASRAKWLGPYYKKIFEKADFITAISRYLKEFALAQGAQAPIEIVPNGVDLKKFSIFNFQFSKNELKEKLGIKEGEKVIITVSRLVEKNGIGDLIEAVAKLPIANYKLLILGSGPMEESLKFKVTSYKLQDRVLFLGDMPNEKVPQYLATADVFVRPSLAEGLGNAFLEAMAAGVPVIGTAVGGIPDFLRDGETGLFCQAGNPENLAGKIKAILTDEKLRQKIIAGGRKLVEQNHSWDPIAEKMKKVFNQLMSS